MKHSMQILGMLSPTWQLCSMVISPTLNVFFLLSILTADRFTCLSVLSQELRNKKHTHSGKAHFRRQVSSVGGAYFLKCKKINRFTYTFKIK